jgi:cytochrome c
MNLQFKTEKEAAVMKRVGIWIISTVCVMAISTAYAGDGEAIFKSQGCQLCHKKESSSKVNPSLTEISQAYQGNEEQLIKYLKGESDAIVKPKKSGMMKRQIQKTKNLSDADLKSLANYLLHQQ